MKKKKLAIFDIDGTIFRKNLHFELIDELAWMEIFPKTARRDLTSVYSKWLNHEGTYEEYRKAIVRIYAKYIKGCRRQVVEEASRKLIPFNAKKTYIYAENLIAKLRREHYHIIAVSGSPYEIVEEYNRVHLKFDRVFGTIYEVDQNGFYTGREAFTPTKHKGQVVQQYVFENGLTLDGSYGVGDTESDVSFLQLVENPIAFNPNKNLCEVASERNWKVVVEKKDVIYEISKI